MINQFNSKIHQKTMSDVVMKVREQFRKSFYDFEEEEAFVAVFVTSFLAVYHLCNIFS